MTRSMIRLLILAILLTPGIASAKSTFTIQNIDAAGRGFNDATPRNPIGGNEGRTLGEQRLNSFKRAAEIWGNILNSDVEIIVRASFAPIGNCDGNSVTLGSARSGSVVSNFPNAPKQGTFYPVALANSLAGTDLTPGSGANDADIVATFNALIDNDNCLGNAGWYYGLDGNHGDDEDLLVVLLHEFAHGLGMSSSVTLTTGAELSNVPHIYETFTLDLLSGLHWVQMTNDQRKASAVNTANLVWDGPLTRDAAARLLGPLTTLSVTAPAEVARNYDIGTASFGPALDRSALSGRVVAAADSAAVAEGGSATDGCSAFTNAADVRGNIALVDRGNCNFILKAENAQNAGATALIIVDNTRDTCMPPGLGLPADTTDTIRIPVLSVNVLDGTAIRGALGSRVDATLRTDGSSRAGASQAGFVRLYAPCTVAGGSSVHHWDIVAAPNLLMEPFINEDLKPSDVDITVFQLMDIGWKAEVAPPKPVTDPIPSGRRGLRRGK
jgi:hypothetical protein